MSEPTSSPGTEKLDDWIARDSEQLGLRYTIQQAQYDMSQAMTGYPRQMSYEMQRYLGLLP